MFFVFLQNKSKIKTMKTIIIIIKVNLFFRFFPQVGLEKRHQQAQNGNHFLENVLLVFLEPKGCSRGNHPWRFPHVSHFRPFVGFLPCFAPSTSRICLCHKGSTPQAWARLTTRARPGFAQALRESQRGLENVFVRPPI